MVNKTKISQRASAIPESATLAITFKSKDLQAQGKDIIGLGAGELDFPTPQGIIDSAYKAASNGATRYTPVPGTMELRQGICDKLKRDNGLSYVPKDIVVSNGAKQTIFNALAALVNPGDPVVVIAPCWLSYPEMINFLGGQMRVVETQDNSFRIHRDRLFAACKGAKVLLVNSPSNPSGAVFTEDEMDNIAKVATANDLIVISDEIYEKLSYDKNHISLASLPGMKDRTILVNGVSKSHAMTGWRIGYSASAPELATAMSRFQAHTTSNASAISQAAALSALSQYEEEVKKMALICRERRDRVIKEVNNIPNTSFAPAEGAFYVFIDISKYLGLKDGPENDLQMAEYLLEHSLVGVVPGTPFLAPGFIRIAYAGDIERILEGVKRIGQGLKKLAKSC